MALAKGVNSNATVEEADTYFADRLDVAGWIDAEAVQKAQALVTATTILNDLDWEGVAVSDLQTLAFPRIGSYFDPRLGKEVVFTTEFPKRLVQGTFELAYHLLNNDGLLDSTGSVVNLNISSISLQRVTSPSMLPLIVKRIIKPLLANKGSRAWWRAN